MKQLSNLRIIPLAALCCAAFVLTLTPAAQAASKAEYYMTSPSSITAGPFATLEQCQATASGINGSCFQDSSATAPSNAYAYAPAGQRHHRK
jgi:hypothetical protein